MTEGYFIRPRKGEEGAPDRTCRLTHNLDSHPSLQIDALANLAHRLMPAGKCRFVDPGIQSDSPFVHTSDPKGGQSLSSVFDNIDTPGSWIALYDVQTDPEYDAVMQDLISFAAHPGVDSSKVRDVRGFIFISAPPSITPFHIDRENNFWLQLRGHKDLYLWDRNDQRVVDQRTVSEFIWSGSLEKVKLTDEKLELAEKFVCGAGDGAYFPSTTPHMTKSDPHWVSPENGVAISIGIVFYTDKTRRDAYIHAFNRILNKFGFTPRPPAATGFRNALKAHLGRWIVALMKRFRGYRPNPSYTA